MNWKRRIAILLAVVMVLTLMPANSSEAKKKISLNKKNVTLTVGKKFQLKLKNASKKVKVTWSSSKKKVATVSKKGLVKAKKAGKAKITAKVKSLKKKYTCKVTVKNKIVKPTQKPLKTQQVPILTNVPVNTIPPVITNVPTAVAVTNAPTTEVTQEPTGDPTQKPTEVPSDYKLRSPRVDSEGNVTWDCAYFGSYYQTAQWKKEPIKWRVLSVDENNNALIVADKNLDCKPYNETYTDVTWETSTLRSWLNGYGTDSNVDGIDYSADNFIDTAFTEEEQEAINTTTVVNNDNPSYGTEGGNNTEDKVYLLSIEEASNVEYGFDSTFDDESKKREVKNTDYAKVNGAYTCSSSDYAGNGDFWLRSPGGDSAGASCVSYDGWGITYGYSFSNVNGVRPALQINLSSSSVWTDAGVTDSEDNDGVSEDNSINNPVVENGVITWDCIYFGSYNQTAQWTREPIKWRVLSVNGDDAFFVADENLDCMSYNGSLEVATWETSAIRSWLNGYGADCNGNKIDYSTDNFIDEAFTEEEQEAINTTTVVNNDNPSYETDGGNNTEDKVYLLSIEEASNVAYGFDSAFDDESKKREVKNTDYAKLNGAYTNRDIGYAGNGLWWLRSPGNNSYYASYVNCHGSGGSETVDIVGNGARPALHIDLSSGVWEHAGTVNSNGDVSEPEVTPTQNPVEPTGEPTSAPTQIPTATPTQKPTLEPGVIYNQQYEVTRWYNDGSNQGYSYAGYKNDPFSIWKIGDFDNEYSTNDEDYYEENDIDLTEYRGIPVRLTGEFMYEGVPQENIYLSVSYTRPSDYPVMWSWREGGSKWPNEYAKQLGIEGVNGSEAVLPNTWTSVDITFTLPNDAYNGDRDADTGKSYGINLYFNNKINYELAFDESNTFHFRNFKLSYDVDGNDDTEPTVEPTSAPTQIPTVAPVTQIPVTLPPATAAPITQAPTTAPTALPEEITSVGKIKVDEANVWQKLLETITFGVYKAPETKVIISSDLEDADIYYFIETSGIEFAYTEEELSSNLVEWTEYVDEFTLEDGKNVVYAKIVDNETGDVHYLCSDGIVIDENIVTEEPSKYGLSNPRVDSEGNVTWDCAYFGSYNQTVKEWNKEPIKWRVLSVDENNNALIVADKNLDCKPYNETYTDVTWETSTIRSWLNGYGVDSNGNGIDYSSDNFIDEAFTEEEQSAINTTTVINNDNSEYGTEGGNNTEDKVYLLSREEASNAVYGFDNTDYYASNKTREVKNTDYAKFNGTFTSNRYVYKENGYSWLRSHDTYSNYATYVFDDGCVQPGISVVSSTIGVRPVLNINLSSLSVWTHAGVIDSEGNKRISDNIINNPIVENGITTWDCIYFGNYNQTVKEWKREPIKWRVLSVDEDDAFFVADKNIDCKPYNEADKDVTWETSTLRSWLNGYGSGFNEDGVDYSSINFIDMAFTQEEQAVINTTTVINNDNISYGTEGGNNTEDKVYLLSVEEVSNIEYGFDSTFDKKSKTRRVKNTDYTNVNNACTVGSGDCAENGYWWLRSPGKGTEESSYVNEVGAGDCGASIFDWSFDFGVRPALHINLSSDVWENAGTVTSVMTDYTEPTPTPAPTPVPTVTPVPTPTPTPMPDVQFDFEEVTNAIPFDVSSYNSLSGNGGYIYETGRVEINDSSSADASQGSWLLPDDMPDIEVGDMVTFRVQGYNYGNSGFRFWIGGQHFGGCTPILLNGEIEEGLEVGEYPCVVEDEETGESLTKNQMKLVVDEETGAFDVTFTFKAGTSQNDVDGLFTHLTLKYIYQGETSGYIDGLCIKNIYYIPNEGEVLPTVTTSPTPTPTPMPDVQFDFEEVTNAIPFDVSSYNSLSGNGGYIYETGRVEINDSSSADASQGSWVLPDDMPDIEVGDMVSFRVQGYNYGNSGFRFWIGDRYFGGCTPILLNSEIDEGLEVGEYPCVVEDEETGESLTKNQMKLVVDEETGAFDVTFTFKAGTSQNDVDGLFTHLTLKYIYQGETSGYIDGLCIKNIYYIPNEGVVLPTATPVSTKEPVVNQMIGVLPTSANIGDIDIELSKANEALNETSNIIEYSNGKANVSLDPIYSGLGVAYYINADKSVVDIEDYEVVINITSENEYPWLAATKSNISTNDYWDEYISYSLDGSTYTIFATPGLVDEYDLIVKYMNVSE